MRHENSSTSGGYLRDAIYGVNDGIITTFAIVAGVAGASLSREIVVILGFANVIADGISMGMSSYLGMKSQRDFEARQRAREEMEIQLFPQEEREEVRNMYQAKGFSGVELERAVEIITGNKKRWVDEMMIGEHGVITGNEETPWSHGVVTFVAFIVAGTLPLIPFVLFGAGGHDFWISVASTATTLFFVGSLRTLLTKQGWLKSGLEMLVIGLIAAGASYGIGALISSLVK
ncbi:MAG: VIT1/CCC1 transporter family protein [bacterium]|nr:VIT1/CCC1 transporter family protein [bacterium]